MKTIKSSKDITTLEVGDKVIFGDLEYIVVSGSSHVRYHLQTYRKPFNDVIFEILNINKENFIRNLGIEANTTVEFPETKSLEALTAIVSALFKEYEKQNELPKTWEEFCERNPFKRGECYISPCCNIIYAERVGRSRNADEDRSSCISKQEAEAFLALMQLRQLRKAYVKDWEPDWINDTNTKYCIEVDCDTLLVHTWYHKNHSLSFPSRELAEQFLTNFKDLLEIAKPLL